jgi:hypothetical protein
MPFRFSSNLPSHDMQFDNFGEALVHAISSSRNAGLKRPKIYVKKKWKLGLSISTLRSFAKTNFEGFILRENRPARCEDPFDALWEEFTSKSQKLNRGQTAVLLAMFVRRAVALTTENTPGNAWALRSDQAVWVLPDERNVKMLLRTWKELHQWIRELLQEVSHKDLYLSAGLPMGDFATLCQFMVSSAAEKVPSRKPGSKGQQFYQAMNKLHDRMTNAKQVDDVAQLLESVSLEASNEREFRHNMEELIDLVKEIASFGLAAEDVDVYTTKQPGKEVYDMLLSLGGIRTKVTQDMIKDLEDAVRTYSNAILGDNVIDGIKVEFFVPQNSLGDLKGGDLIKIGNSHGTLGVL